MPTRRLKAALDDSERNETPTECYSPEEVVERERAERSAQVIDKWWYRDRDGEGVLLRYRLEAVDCDVILQTVLNGEYWVTGWPAKKKVPLYRAYEGSGKLPVFVVEGEYAVESARAMGLSAVTSAGGADDVERSEWRPLAGQPVVITPRNCDEGRGYARAAARMVLALGPPLEARMLALPGLEEGEGIGSFGWDLKLSPQALGKRVRQLAVRAPVMRAADVEGWPVMEPLTRAPPAAMRWLWPGRVAIGKPLVIFGGLDPGKSIIALNLAVRVSAGAQWPDGGEGTDGGRAPRGKVILMSREDHLRDTVRPRLDQAGADPEKIITLNSVTRIIGGKEVRRDITLRDLAYLERAIEMAGNVRLVVIDPLSAYLGSDMPTRHRVRPAIRGLADLADRHGLAVVITAELGGRDGLGYGANMALMSAVRSAWMLAAEPGNRRLLLPLKSIAGEAAGGLACCISQNSVEWESAPVAVGADPILGTGLPAADLPNALIRPALSLPAVSPPAVSLPNPPAVRMPNLLNPSNGRRGPSPVCREAAGQWLQQQLAGGPVLVGAPGPGAGEPGTLRAAAESAGLAWTSIQRASQDLQVVSERSPDTGKYIWRLSAGVPAGADAPPGSDKSDAPQH